MKNNETFFPYAASAACGFVVYIALIAVTGRNEAWDDGLYYSIGMPLMCFGAFVIGYLFPVKPWRWALSMACGQVIGALLNGSSLNLLPFAMIFMAIISLPQLIAAIIGAKLARKKATE
jgi:hypothetical protein